MKTETFREYKWVGKEVIELLKFLNIEGRLEHIYASNADGQPYLSVKVKVNENLQ